MLPWAIGFYVAMISLVSPSLNRIWSTLDPVTAEKSIMANNVYTQTQGAKTIAYVCQVVCTGGNRRDVNPCTHGPLIADVVKRIAVDTT